MCYYSGNVVPFGLSLAVGRTVIRKGEVMAILDEMKVGDIYICPSTWTRLISESPTCHICQVVSINLAHRRPVVTVKILTKTSSFINSGRFKLTPYNCEELTVLDSIHRLILGVLHRVDTR